MKCIRMNKNTDVLIAKYNTLFKFFEEIIEVKNIDYVQLIIKEIYENKPSYDLRVAAS